MSKENVTPCTNKNYKKIFTKLLACALVITLLSTPLAAWADTGSQHSSSNPVSEESFLQKTLFSNNETTRNISWFCTSLLISIFLSGIIKFSAYVTSEEGRHDIASFISYYKRKYIVSNKLDLNKIPNFEKSLKKALDEKIIGHEREKNEVVKIVGSWMVNRLNGGEQGLTLTLIGSHASGKSTVAKAVADCIGGIFFELNIADYIARTNGNRETAANAFMKKDSEKLSATVTGSYERFYDSKFTEFLKMSNGRPAVLLMDDVGKINQYEAQMLDAKDYKKYSLIEAGRNHLDYMKFFDKDSSKWCIINTSNESLEELTGGDVSSTSRLKPTTVYFDENTVVDFANIFSEKSKPILEKYRNTYNLSCTWDESAINNLAKETYESGNSVREVIAKVNDLQYELEHFAINNKLVRNGKNCETKVVISSDGKKININKLD